MMNHSYPIQPSHKPRFCSNTGTYYNKPWERFFIHHDEKSARMKTNEWLDMTDQSITTYGELSKDKIQVSSYGEIIENHYKEHMHWVLRKETISGNKLLQEK